MYISDLLEAVREIVVFKVRNGEITERALARRIGLSQPHVHNLLKGVRTLSAPAADLMLEGLGLTVLDLLAVVKRGCHATSAWNRPPEAPSESGNAGGSATPWDEPTKRGTGFPPGGERG